MSGTRSGSGPQRRAPGGPTIPRMRGRDDHAVDPLLGPDGTGGVAGPLPCADPPVRARRATGARGRGPAGRTVADLVAERRFPARAGGAAAAPRPQRQPPPAHAARAGPAGGGPAVPPDPPPRPRVEPELGILGLSRRARSRVGSRLFALFFVLVYLVIAVHLVVSLVSD